MIGLNPIWLVWILFVLGYIGDEIVPNYVGMIIRKMVHLPTFALDLYFSPDPGN